MHRFTYNPELDRIELDNTGLQVAIRDSADQFTPDLDPKIGKSIALHLINGMSRIHECRWGTGEAVAARLTEGNFGDTPQWKQERYGNQTFTLGWSEYSDTIRIEETNMMVMKKNDNGRWQFDFDSACDEPTLQRAFLRFHTNPDARTASGPDMLAILDGKSPSQHMDNDDYTP